MTAAHFERLSAMDSSFLSMEDGRAHMHMGAVSVYEAAPLRAEGGGIDVERILSFAEAQLQKVPRLRQRLAWVPGFGHPVWVDDERFNLRYHVRHTALPPPGDERQLKRLAGRVLSQEFDRGRPLWEDWFVEGLEGDRFALISKVHHCMADGLGGVAIANLLVGTDPHYEPPPAEVWAPRPAPGGAELVAGELRHQLAAPARLLRASGDREGRPTRATPSAAGMWKLVGNAVRRGSPTPLNVGLGPFRRFDWTRLPFDEVRAVGKRAGGTVNDVVLAVATGAVRNLLQRRGTDVERLDFRAVVPVSVRGAADRSALGNRVSELIAALPIAEEDPFRRLDAVIELTRDLKSSGESGAGELLAQGFDLVPSRLLGPLFRLASRASVANMIITNVPGPRVPVYLLGARQLATYPVVPLMDHQTLGIALMSYEDGLFWGFNADWDAVPELHAVVEDVESGFSELVGRPSGTT